MKPPSRHTGGRMQTQRGPARSVPRIRQFRGGSHCNSGTGGCRVKGHAMRNVSYVNILSKGWKHHLEIRKRRVNLFAILIVLMIAVPEIIGHFYFDTQ